jgi:L-histidine Nalpha-methyltransferase
MSTASRRERMGSRFALQPVAAPRPEPAEDLRADVLRGLAAPQRKIPPKYFYDEQGARLFERICRLPEYYPTRTEMRILEEHGAAIAAEVGPSARIVEFGSGSGDKTKILLRHLAQPASYVPIDISAEQLYEFADELRSEFTGLRVQPLAGDYSADISLPDAVPGTARTVGFFPGSTIGNFEVAEAERFLQRARELCGPGSAFIVGADLHKDAAVLERAYNDAEGVTAEFNLNLLRRINRECGADFPLDAFSHRAIYDEQLMRIEMHLVCMAGCVVHVPYGRGRPGAAAFRFEPGEYILTEYSHKYTPDSFTDLAASGGWSVHGFWTDAENRFSVWLLG